MNSDRLELADLKPNTRYLELSLIPFTKDNDCFKTPAPITRACGESLGYGSLFAYLFRRFGYPNAGWDDYKQLTKYYLTTSLPDMVLLVTPYIGDSTNLHFRFMVEAETFNRLEAYGRQEQNDWTGRMFDWIEANDLLPDWMDEFVVACNREIAPVSNWREAFGQLCWFTSEEEGSEHKFFGDWYKEITGRYTECEPRPGYKARTLDWTEWPDDDPLKKYHQAAYDALMDLRRPVCVRDTHINCFGRAYDVDDEVDFAKSAGYACGIAGNEAPEEFSELQALIFKLGNGDAKTGLDTIIAAAKTLLAT